MRKASSHNKLGQVQDNKQSIMWYFWTNFEAVDNDNQRY